VIVAEIWYADRLGPSIRRSQVHTFGDSRGARLSLRWDGEADARIGVNSIARGRPDFLGLQICFNELLVDFD